MKKLILILILYIPAYGFSQVGWDFGFGYGKDPAFKVDLSYRLKDHQAIVTYLPYVNQLNPLKTIDIVSVNYGYNTNGLIPYIGWSNKGFAGGISKYHDNGIFTLGFAGDYSHVSLVAGNLTSTENKALTNNDLTLIGLQLISGFSNGLHESIQSRHWGSGKFWDNSISWKNKYKDWDGGDHRAKFPGSKTVLVGFTDGYHLTNLISNAANIGTLAVALGGKEKKDLKTIAKKVLISVVANRAAYYVAYYKTFK